MTLKPPSGPNDPLVFDTDRWDHQRSITVDTMFCTTVSTMTAGRGQLNRVRGSKVGAVGISFYIELNGGVGTICVAVYTNAGVGRGATPLALKATSGSVACPASGQATVFFTGSPVNILDGEWLSIWRPFSGNTAEYRKLATLPTSQITGTAFQADGFPATSTFTNLTTNGDIYYMEAV